MKIYQLAARSALLLLTLLTVFFQSVFAIGVCSVYNSNSGSLVAVGVNPRLTLVDDLNGDNAPDAIAVTGSSSSGGAATVLLNNGRGGLAVFTSLQTAFSIGTAVTADFNLDGAPDLALAGSSSFSGNTTPLNVYLGNGNGVFSAPVTASFAGSAVGASVGDFNADGLPDIVLANASGSGGFGAAALMLNAGAGNFVLAGNFAVGGTPRDVRAADFNGDGNLDAVTINTNGTGSLLLGNGAGGFQAASGFPLFAGNVSSTFNVSLATGDFNNDGRPDLAVGNGDGNFFSVLLNNGGVFAAPVTNTLTDFNFRPRAIVAGRFVGDGNTDLAVVVNNGFSDSISAVVIVPGTGTASFNGAAATTAPTGASPVFVAAGDFNLDGRSDLITANSGSSDVSLIYNNGFDRYGPTAFPVNPFPNQIAAGDFNGDGNLDTAVSSSQQSSGTSGIVLSYGNGAGGVAGTATVGSGTTQALLTGEVNNDGRIDLITATTAGQLGVYRNIGGNPPYSNPPDIYNLGFTARSLVLADFNNDGHRDLAASAQNGNSIAILLGSSTGSFSAPSVLAGPASGALLAAADFNGDGSRDLALAGNGFNGTAGVFVLLGNGNGSFNQVSESLAINGSAGLVAGDFNGDGRDDLAAAGSGSFSSSGTIAVAFGDGDGTFTSAGSYALPFAPQTIAAADFNGDGRLDLTYTARASNSYSVLLNAGNGFFRAGGNFLAGIFPEGLAVGDFNGDGRNDLATANRGANNFSILTNACLEAVTKTDYTGDGRTDFAVFRPSSGTWRVLGYTGGERQISFGRNGDVPVPGDYDGDGLSDTALFRPSSGTWHILRSSNNISYTLRWGISGDVPVARDYDGDGRTDLAVFRPSSGVWYILRSSQPNAPVILTFGLATDKPVPADYDGDGRADVAVYRDGVWYILQSRNGAVRYEQFGLAADKPVPADYDGDGQTDVAVYRGGVWYILQSRARTFRVESFGLADDAPQVGDYDGDGRADLAVYRAADNNWYVLESSNRSFRAVNWGQTGEVPVSSVAAN